MEPYEIGFQPSVEKDLRKLSVENCDRIMVRIEALANEPFPTQVVKLKLQALFLLNSQFWENLLTQSAHKLLG